MNENIKLILSLSISGSIIAGIIFSVKPIIKHKLSKSIQYYIWLVVLLRLVVPFSFETSIMNKVFYSNNTPTAAAAEGGIGFITPTAQNVSIPVIDPKVALEDSNIQPIASAKSLDIKALLKNNLLFIWLLGVLIAFIGNLWGYSQFIKHLSVTNKPPKDDENVLLEELINGRHRVTLVRNKFASTPMLLGIIRPCIVIPDNDFTYKQLRNILLHEITHLRRFDMGIKWLTVMAASLHWFNPLMYFIKKEIGNACELSCDEGVIKNLNDEDKQAYGDTLISVVAENKYSIGILSTTMCEEKKTLKERLVSIMNHSKKSKLITIVSAILLVLVICASVVLGAGVGVNGKLPPNIYIASEFQKTKTAATGGYSWKSGRSYILADADHPKNFEYKNENIVSVTALEQIVIGTQKIKSDKKYSFTIEKIEVYKDGQLIELKSVAPSFLNNNLYLQAPGDSGEYTYCLLLNFKDRGTVNYGFVVRVDMATYDLTEIEKYQTPYVGNHNKVMDIVSLLPVPDSNFKQQYISMKTSAKPYKLDVYYEGVSDNGYRGEWSISTSNSSIYAIVQKNALVLFYMIDNLDEVTFAFRNTPSPGDLETSKYDSKLTFSRESIEKVYGNQIMLLKDIGQLQDIINGKSAAINNEIDKQLTTIMSSPMTSSNPGDYIAAHLVEYNAIVSMSESALPYLIDILNGGDRGLRGNIVNIICSDIVKELSNSKDRSVETENIIKTTQDAVNKWNSLMGYTSEGTLDPMPEFTDEEVNSARKVVEEYYRAILAKDDKAILATLHERSKSDNMELYGVEKRTLLAIDYNSQDLERRNYRVVDGVFTPNKVIVFKVKFNIEYPKGVGGPWNNGVYNNWSMILTRDNEKSPWVIFDQGY